MAARPVIPQACGIVLIDFGLGQGGSMHEEKAVDLYVMERALLSTHRDSQGIVDEVS